MRQSPQLIAGAALGALALLSGCAGASSPSERDSVSAPRDGGLPTVSTSPLPTLLPSSSVSPTSTPTSAAPTPTASATAAPVATSQPTTATAPRAATGGISPRAFGMHFLALGSRPYPVMPFHSARTQDMGVTWADLQPNGSRWDPAALARLDAIVRTFQSHAVQPLIVLGMTPGWAAARCAHGSWPATTCGPRSTGLHSPWAAYVRALAHRYRGVWFETWNEPNLKNGYNDSIAKLARLQATAYTVIHNAGSGDHLVSPTVAVTADNPLGFLRTFFHETGGKRFDVFGLHLYPSDKSARQGWGPERSIQTLAQVRSILRANHIAKPIWDTEANVGRYIARTTTSRTFSGWAGAAMVARMYVLQLSNHVQRLFWYAADDRSWGGTWMEKSDYRTLTYAGLAERTAYNLLVHARIHRCSHTTTSAGTRRYTCKFHLANGRNMLVKWTTHGSYYWHAPAHSSRTYNAIGGSKAIRGGTLLKVTTTPRYVIGSFAL